MSGENIKEINNIFVDMNFLVKNRGYKFGRVKNIIKDEIEMSMLKQEIRDCWKCNSADIIIEEIQDLFILYIKPYFVKELEKYISREKYEYLIKNNKGIVAGYILFYRPNYHIKSTKRINIRFCDTIIPKLNILNQIIEWYATRYKFEFILPYEPLATATKYWEKYFLTNYGINNKNELIKFKEMNKLNFLIDHYFC
jgi:hypothetical protein